MVRSRVAVKSWTAREPLADEVRPASCPSCEAASRPIGGKLVLVGHGHRGRQLQGPREASGEPALELLRLQRFLCESCRVTCTVGPRELVTRRLFSLPAIVWALALFGLQREPAAAVRRRVSPWKVVGPCAAAGWCTLRRWIRAVRAGRLLGCVRGVPAAFTARQSAERAATTVAAHAPASPEPPPLSAQAFLGAAHAW